MKLLARLNRRFHARPDASIGFCAKTESFDQGRMGRVLYVLNRRPEMTGEAVSNAVMKFGLDPRTPSAAGVSMTLTTKGANIFRKVTGANVGRQLAIVLDNKVASAPVIRDRIPTGQAQITGRFTAAEAGDLAIVLRAGALPGADQRRRGADRRTVAGRRLDPRAASAPASSARSSWSLFMLIYYRGSGVIAIFALVLNMFFLFAGMAALRGTLPCPGIAGIVLTVGMAVDANVLIFERIREELRAGKTVRARGRRRLRPGLADHPRLEPDDT